MKKITLLKTLTIALFLMMGVGNAWGQTALPFTFTGPWNDYAQTTGLTRSNSDTYNSDGEAKLVLLGTGLR